VPAPERILLALAREEVVPELAECLKQAVPGTPLALHNGDERLVGKAGQHGDGQARGDEEGGVGVEVTDEHGEGTERSLLLSIEKLVAPLDGGAHAAVAGG
jgi:hypothetical protein